MKKTTTTKAGAAAAAASLEANKLLKEIEASLDSTPEIEATEATTTKAKAIRPAETFEHFNEIDFDYWVHLLETGEIRIEEHNLVTITTKEDWNRLADLIQYNRTDRTLPGNRDEKPGHAKTLRDKDIPTIESYDFKRGYLAINCHSWNCINHGHRFRRLDDLIQSSNEAFNLRIFIALTEAEAEGFDGTQANWTVADGANAELKQEGYNADEAKYLATFMQQGSSLLLTRLQNLAPKGGQQSGNTYLAKPLTPAQKQRLWSHCPLHLKLWDLLAVRTKTGRTIAEIVLNASDLLGKGQTLSKLRADLALIALVDAIPEALDGKKFKTILQSLEESIMVLDKALKPIFTLSQWQNINDRYRFIVAMWKTIDAGYAPTFEKISSLIDESGYPTGLQTLKTEHLEQMKEALAEATKPTNA